MTPIETIPSDSLLKLEHENPLHSETIVVNWCITTRCNYRCLYCSNDLNGGQFPGVDLDTCRRFVDRLLEHYAGRLGKKVFIELTGGEATLYPGLLELLRHIKNQGGNCGLISNGSLRLEKWDEVVPLLDHLCLSFHPRQSRPSHFLELARKVHPLTSTHFNIMMYPQLFDQALEMATSLKSAVTDSTIQLQPLLEKLNPGMPMMQYTEVQHQVMTNFDGSTPWLRKGFSTRGGMTLIDSQGGHVLMQPPQIVLAKINRWKNWTCWVGLECLVIKADGEIFRAWCRQDLVGWIHTFDWEFPTTPTICKRDSCHCNADITTSRARRTD